MPSVSLKNNTTQEVINVLTDATTPGEIGAASATNLSLLAGSLGTAAGANVEDFAPALTTDENYVTDTEKLALHAHSNKSALDQVSGINTGDNAPNPSSAPAVHNHHVGLKTEPVITDHGNATLTISETLAYKPGANLAEQVTIASTLLTATDGTHYACTDTQTLAWVLLDSQALIDRVRYIPYKKIIKRTGSNSLHFQDISLTSSGVQEIIHQRELECETYSVAKGALLGLAVADGTLAITCGGGPVYTPWHRYVIAPVTPATRQFQNLKIGGEWAVSPGSHVAPVINNSQYQGVTDPVTLSDGFWTINYIFRGIEDQDHLYTILGAEEFASLELAQASSLLADVPSLVADHALLVGRSIVQKGATTGIVTESAFTTIFKASTAITDHGSQTGLGDDDHPQYLLAPRQYSGAVIGTDVSLVEAIAAINDALTIKEYPVTAVIPVGWTILSGTVADLATLGGNTMILQEGGGAGSHVELQFDNVEQLSDLHAHYRYFSTSGNLSGHTTEWRLWNVNTNQAESINVITSANTATLELLTKHIENEADYITADANKRVRLHFVHVSNTSSLHRLELDHTMVAHGIEQVGAVYSHKGLSDRSAPDQHVIGSTTGLTEALDTINKFTPMDGTGNLPDTVDTLQELAQAVDDLVVGGGGIPAGTIIRSSSNTPSGCLPCEGQLLDQATYSALFAAVGNKFNYYANRYTNGQPWAHQYSFNTTPTAVGAEDITGWTAGTGLSGGVSQMLTLVTNSRIYLIGGVQGASVLATVRTAPINPDGTLGAWTTAADFPIPIYDSHILMTNSRVYVIGGYSTSARTTAVYTAPINPDGTLGTWAAGTAFPVAVTNSSLIVTSSRVYMLGGSTPSSINTIYTALINPDGTLGTWSAVGSLPVAGDGWGFVTNRRAYHFINSGIYTAPINADGTLGSWIAAGSTPVEFYAGRFITTRDVVYMVSPLNSAVVYRARISPDGLLGAWSAGTALAGQRRSAAVFITKDRIHVVGGRDASTSYNTVYSATLPAAASLDNNYMDKTFYSAADIAGKFYIPDLSYESAIAPNNNTLVKSYITY